MKIIDCIFSICTALNSVHIAPTIKSFISGCFWYNAFHSSRRYTGCHIFCGLSRVKNNCNLILLYARGPLMTQQNAGSCKHGRHFPASISASPRWRRSPNAGSCEHGRHFPASISAPPRWRRSPNASSCKHGRHLARCYSIYGLGSVGAPSLVNSKYTWLPSSPKYFVGWATVPIVWPFSTVSPTFTVISFS